MPRQLLLDLSLPPSATFDNFVVGANFELTTRFAELHTALASGQLKERIFYIWGNPGSGRSHLLHALCHSTAPSCARLLSPNSPLAAFEFDPAVAIYAIDGCDKLSPHQQIAAFNLFNQVHAYPYSAFAASGSAPPLALTIREDLRTRLGWGLIFQVAELDDAGKISALEQAALARGFTLAPEIPAYLLAHFRRDLPSLMALLDTLDQFSLERQRTITLPLLREMLANSALSEVSDAAQSFK